LEEQLDENNRREIMMAGIFQNEEWVDMRARYKPGKESIPFKYNSSSWLLFIL